MATRARFSPLELDRIRHRAGAAAGAAHGDQDVLLLLLVEIATVEHLPSLLLEQLVQREAAVGDLLIGRGGRLGWLIGVLGAGRRVSLRWLALRHTSITHRCWSVFQPLRPTPSPRRPPAEIPCARARLRPACRSGSGRPAARSRASTDAKSAPPA